MYKLWVQNGNYKILAGGSTDGTGCNLLRLYNNRGCAFSLNSYDNVSTYDHLITEWGINYTINGSNGTTRYTMIGAKKSPVIRFNADLGTIELYGENGSGSDWRSPNLNLGVLINPDGKVGIGMTPSYYKLDVNGDINAWGNVRSFGNIISSDSTIKTDIHELASGNLEKIRSLKAVTFKYKVPDSSSEEILTSDSSLNTTDSEKYITNPELYQQTQIGLIAQNLQKVYPELVIPDKKGVLGIKYTGLIPVLIDAINELDSINIEKDKKINDLESRINNLESILNTSGIKKGTTQNTIGQSISQNIPRLNQNAPNPFSNKTEIS